MKKSNRPASYPDKSVLGHSAERIGLEEELQVVRTSNDGNRSWVDTQKVV